jgi:hypothetical protein
MEDVVANYDPEDEQEAEAAIVWFNTNQVVFSNAVSALVVALNHEFANLNMESLNIYDLADQVIGTEDETGLAEQALNNSERDMFRIKGIQSDLDEIYWLFTSWRNHLDSIGFRLDEVLDDWDNLTLDDNLATLGDHFSKLSYRIENIEEFASKQMPPIGQDPTIITLNRLSNDINGYFNSLFGTAALAESVAELDYQAGQMEGALDLPASQEVRRAAFRPAAQNYDVTQDTLSYAIGFAFFIGNEIIALAQEASGLRQNDTLKQKGIAADLRRLSEYFDYEDDPWLPNDTPGVLQELERMYGRLSTINGRIPTQLGQVNLQPYSSMATMLEFYIDQGMGIALFLGLL